MEIATRTAHIIEALRLAYPDAVCALRAEKDYELMISVRLSAQCTDERVNQITPALFDRFPTLEAFAQADVAEVEEYVRSCGFYKHKARDIVLACQTLLRDYGGRVPDTMEELLKIPGVGRTTANLLLGDLYRVPGSVVCDTHCIRISNLLGRQGGAAASPDPATGREQRFLSPHCTPRQSRLHRPEAQLRCLYAGALLPLLSGRIESDVPGRKRLRYVFFCLISTAP